MQQLPAKTTSPHTDHGMVASLMDVRPAAPKVEPSSMGGIDVPAAIRKRPFLVIVTFALTMLAGAPYLMRKAPREYHAEAAIYVSPTYFKNLQQDREQLQISYSTLVNQQILTLRRYDILREALKRLEQKGIHWRKPDESEEAAVARLTKDLDVQHIPDSYEVLVGLDEPERDWVAPIVNTVANTYLDKGKEDELSDRNDRMTALTTELSNIQVELQKKLEEQSALSQQLMTVSLDKATPVDDTLLAAARQAREDARHRRMEAEAQLSVMEATNGGGTKSPLGVLAEEAVSNDPDLHLLTNSLIQRRSELGLRTAGLTPQHPLRQAADKEIADINNQLVHLRQGSTDDTAARMLVKLRGDVDRSRLIESELDQEVQLGASKVLERSRQVQQVQGLNGDIQRLRVDQSAISSRIDELRMGDNAPGYLRMFSAAQTPIEALKTNVKKFLGALFGVALFLAVALAVAKDLIDQRLQSPSEVKRAIGFPPVGIILEHARGTLSFADEHFQRLVNGIQRGMAAEEAKCLVLTPLSSAHNPPSLVTDIGRALLARGLKTAIVEANPRRSKERAATNLSDVLRAKEPPPNCSSSARTEMGSQRDLARIPVDGASYGGMLQDLRREFDVILIDTPPLRLSADAEYLASISDITLVVVEAGHATRRELTQEAALLGQIGTPSVGVIMSGVRLRLAGKALKRDFKEFSSLSPSSETAGGTAGAGTHRSSSAAAAQGDDPKTAEQVTEAAEAEVASQRTSST
jgi:polysaccharide biosynthesis transport protein